MSFIDQKPFTVTKEHLRFKWAGLPASENFRCAWCGHTFKEGDTARWVYTNHGRYPDLCGNPFICQTCDGAEPVIMTELQRLHDEVTQDKYWWVVER